MVWELINRLKGHDSSIIVIYLWETSTPLPGEPQL